MPYHFVKARGKNDKLAAGGFMYHLGHRNEISRLYYCEERAKEDVNCQGAVRMLDTGKILIHTAHDHPPRQGNQEAQILKAKISEEAQTHLLTNPKDIVSQTTNGASKDTLSLLPKNLSRMIRKAKAKIRPTFKAPNSLKDIDVEAFKHVMTCRKEKMFYYDSGMKNKTRFLIFATPQNLEVLKSCKVLAVDGTFDPVPKNFAQLWSLHGMINGKFVPLVFCLLSHKTQSMYEDVLRALPKLENLRFTIGDFEQASLNAISVVYPHVRTFGCMFHFKKCVNKKINKLGVYKKKDPLTRSLIKKYMGRFAYLGFSQRDDVQASFDIMMDDLELTSLLEQSAVDKFRAYMTITWVGTDAERPIYAHEIWNWYESTSFLGIRTNNAVEAWNLSFQCSLNCKGRPGLPRFLDTLKAEHESINLRLAEANQIDTSIGQIEAQIRDLIYNYAAYTRMLPLTSMPSRTSTMIMIRRLF
uniref:MULE transposase domain-containing protein n=1 Tax=Acrobeloides nanus TaxID=290746 RepID=A0A914CKW9_9BILA